jgi:pimeloyl-ACP methyl ester carboxylesterase
VRRSADPEVTTPLLYLRCEHERGDITAYVRGFRAAGIVNVEHGVVPGAVHFTQEEAPRETWELISGFVSAS